jgi:hypothetical protein
MNQTMKTRRGQGEGASPQERTALKALDKKSAK